MRRRILVGQFAPRSHLPSQKEIERRYNGVRSQMHKANLDALLVCGNQYAGFEGAVFYMSGFEIVHRYVYVLFPLQGEPTLVFPREARWIGDKAKPWVKDHVWPVVPGQWLRDIALEHKWKRLGVYGMNFVMAVRDYRELSTRSYETPTLRHEIRYGTTREERGRTRRSSRRDGHHSRRLLGAGRRVC